MNVDTALLERCVALAAGWAGLRSAWCWAFLEAIVLPLPPELFLIPLAVATPDRAPVLAAAAILGSLSGGVVSYGLGWRWPERTAQIFTRLPGVGEHRMAWARMQVKHRGARFIAISPWLVLPYKVTSVASGRQRIAWWRYLLAGAVGRGTRLSCLTLAAAGLSSAGGPSLVRAHFLVAVALAYVTIGIVVWLLRRQWLRYWT